MDLHKHTYVVIIVGHLDQRWESWFEPLTITRLPDGQTRLAGPLVDEAALHGILRRIHDLSLPLLYLSRDDFQYTP